MTRQETWMDVKLLYQQGASIREIARRTKLSRKTVRKIVRQPVPKRYGPRAARPSKLAPFLPQLEALLAELPHAPATVLCQRLRDRHGGACQGSCRLFYAA